MKQSDCCKVIYRDGCLTQDNDQKCQYTQQFYIAAMVSAFVFYACREQANISPTAIAREPT